MEKKYTTLSRKELKLIENLMLKHGNVVSFDMINNELQEEMGRQEVKNFVSGIVKKGWLVRIKKGVFTISNIASRGTVPFNQLVIAQIINKNSYVSFEGALQYYGFFDQYLRIITSIGIKKTKSTKFKKWVYRYIKDKKNLLSDYDEINMDGFLIKIASKEKTIIDFIVYRRTVATLDLIIEILKKHKNNFDCKKIIDLSKDYSLTVRRTLGYVLDICDIDTEELLSKTKKNKNYSIMVSKRDFFNAKWRIYIDEYFKKYE